MGAQQNFHGCTMEFAWMHNRISMDAQQNLHGHSGICMDKQQKLLGHITFNYRGKEIHIYIYICYSFCVAEA